MKGEKLPTREEFAALVLQDAKKSADYVEDSIQGLLANYLRKNCKALSLACSLAARWEQACAEAAALGDNACAAKHCAHARKMRRLETQLKDLVRSLRNDPFKGL